MGGGGWATPWPGRLEPNGRLGRQPRDAVPSTRWPSRRQPPRAAAVQRQAACGCQARNPGGSPTPPSPFTGACADENLESPSHPTSRVLGRWRSLPSPGLGTEMRTGRILKAGLLGPLRGVWQRAEEKTGNGGEGVTDGDANERGKMLKKTKKDEAPGGGGSRACVLWRRRRAGGTAHSRMLAE